jgi:hypothetical protein
MPYGVHGKSDCINIKIFYTLKATDAGPNLALWGHWAVSVWGPPLGS